MLQQTATPLQLAHGNTRVFHANTRVGQTQSLRQQRQPAAAAGPRRWRPASERRSAAVRAAAQQQVSLGSLSPSDSTKAAQLKAEIVRQAGSRNGTNLGPEQHTAIKELLSQLEALSPAQQVQY